jgi:hypothetical protein
MSVRGKLISATLVRTFSKKWQMAALFAPDS